MCERSGSSSSLNRATSPTGSTRSSRSGNNAQNTLEEKILEAEMQALLYTMRKADYIKEMEAKLAALDRKIADQKKKNEEHQKQIEEKKLKMECILRAKQFDDIIRELKSKLESVSTPNEVDADFLTENNDLRENINMLQNSLVLKNFSEKCDIDAAFTDLHEISNNLVEIRLKMENNGIDKGIALAKKYADVQNTITKCFKLKEEISELLLRRTTLEAGLKSETLDI